MTSTRTRLAMVRDALRFYNEPEIFIGIGRTTPWDGETDPLFTAPAPDMERTSVEEIVAYKKVHTIYLVKPTLANTGSLINWRGSNYEIIDPADALAEGAHWVYFRTDIVEAELAPVTFRQIGVFTGLQRGENVLAGKTILLPSEVANHGYLEMIENRKAVPHEVDSTETIQYIREF